MSNTRNTPVRGPGDPIRSGSSATGAPGHRRGGRASAATGWTRPPRAGRRRGQRHLRTSARRTAGGRVAGRTGSRVTCSTDQVARKMGAVGSPRVTSLKSQTPGGGGWGPSPPRRRPPRAATPRWSGLDETMRCAPGSRTSVQTGTRRPGSGPDRRRRRGGRRRSAPATAPHVPSSPHVDAPTSRA